jgi:hypothetical protein
MAQHRDLERLLATASRLVAPVVQQAFQAGLKIGAEQEKARVADALKALGISLAGDKPTATPKSEQKGSGKSPPKSGEYGAITGPVRRAVRELDPGPHGVSPQEVLDYIHNWSGTSDIDVMQVRTAMKVLAKRDELTRVERGRYTKGPKLKADKPAQQTIFS